MKVRGAQSRLAGKFKQIKQQAERLLSAGKQPLIEIVELEEGAIVPEPTEGFLQWIIEYKNDEET